MTTHSFAAQPLGHALRRLAATLAAAYVTLDARVRRITPEQVVFVVMAVLLALFVIVLLTVPTGAGRGGR